MKAQTMELLEILVIVVGISILMILSYFLFSQATKVSSSALVEESQYEKVASFVTNFFYSRIPDVDKTMAQLLADRIVADSDVVYYGDRYGGLNVTKIIYDYFDSYFSKRWNLSISLEANVKNSVLWIPNSGDGNSVSKINVKDGTETGRYYTVPSDVSDGNPSRVSLDSQGNVWVGNRGTRTIVKIGLQENGQCVDKNGNGAIETSYDTDKDGTISIYEMNIFGQDECMLAEVFLGGVDYGSFGSGGVRAVCLDEEDNVYAGLYDEKKLFYISKDGSVVKEWGLPVSPYGCFVDGEIVWISGQTTKKLVRFDTKTEAFKVIDIGHVVYGIAPCFKEDCLVITGWSDKKLTKLNTTTDQIIFSMIKPELDGGRGVTVDEEENIYAVSSAKNLVIKYDKNGNEIARASTCGTPTGVGIDVFGKIWVTCMDSGIRRYSKNLSPEIANSFGTGHYVYNFFTSYNLKPIRLEKYISFGYLPKEERVRTFVIKLPLPQPLIGGVVDVLLKQW